jgi:hypothetical protein
VFRRKCSLEILEILGEILGTPYLIRLNLSAGAIAQEWYNACYVPRIDELKPYSCSVARFATGELIHGHSEDDHHADHN